ncbi:uncharacterized protein BJ171DRAFT_511433 [Polychytrium aggregatum]|uniref:uncharacterized protein n=1 Tax=Polychytrium aggregatum TaxID=110093 RepID=UPI0022FDCD5D|nr:uncharacterized protein BJ171DRAFT_511433 [Polychytrium aggregatum]KAI9202966.1 hypothetical protein BJ171DRAFT_511433 [Polychytrium aggregatum]
MDASAAPKTHHPSWISVAPEKSPGFPQLSSLPNMLLDRAAASAAQPFLSSRNSTLPAPAKKAASSSLGSRPQPPKFQTAGTQSLRADESTIRTTFPSQPTESSRAHTKTKPSATKPSEAKGIDRIGLSGTFSNLCNSDRRRLLALIHQLAVSEQSRQRLGTALKQLESQNATVRADLDHARREVSDSQVKYSELLESLQSAQSLADQYLAENQKIETRGDSADHDGLLVKQLEDSIRALLKEEFQKLQDLLQSSIEAHQQALLVAGKGSQTISTAAPNSSSQSIPHESLGDSIEADPSLSFGQTTSMQRLLMAILERRRRGTPGCDLQTSSSAPVLTVTPVSDSSHSEPISKPRSSGTVKAQVSRLLQVARSHSPSNPSHSRSEASDSDSSESVTPSEFTSVSNHDNHKEQADIRDRESPVLSWASDSPASQALSEGSPRLPGRTRPSRDHGRAGSAHARSSSGRKHTVDSTDDWHDTGSESSPQSIRQEALGPHNHRRREPGPKALDRQISVSQPSPPSKIKRSVCAPRPPSPIRQQSIDFVDARHLHPPTSISKSSRNKQQLHGHNSRYLRSQPYPPHRQYPEARHSHQLHNRNLGHAGGWDAPDYIPPAIRFAVPHAAPAARASAVLPNTRLHAFQPKPIEPILSSDQIEASDSMSYPCASRPDQSLLFATDTSMVQSLSSILESIGDRESDSIPTRDSPGEYYPKQQASSQPQRTLRAKETPPTRLVAEKHRIVRQTRPVQFHKPANRGSAVDDGHSLGSRGTACTELDDLIYCLNDM